MQKERFYIGNAKDETVQEFLKKYDNPFIAGFCEGEEWCVFVDTIAITEYKLFKLERFYHTLKNLLPRIRSSNEFKDVIDTIEKAVLSTVQTPLTEVDESKLAQRIIYQINEGVLHELIIHYTGKLSHYFISSIRFVDKKLNKEEVYRLVEKYDLKKVNIFLDHGGERVRGLKFEEAEEQCEKIRKLCDELKSKDLKLEVGYTGKKEYPIEFGLDDIKILEKKTRAIRGNNIRL